MQPVNRINNKSRQLTLPLNIINRLVKLSPFAVKGALNKGSLLLKLIRKDLDVLLFSGFTWNEIKADTIKKQLLTQIDATLLGRYNKNLPHPFYGKKLVVNGNRIKKEELKPWLNTEIVINGNNVQITGLYKQSEKINEVC